MILDAVIALLFSSLELLVMVVVAPINGLLALIEFVISRFIDGFSIGRIGRKSGQSKTIRRIEAATSVTILIALIGAFSAPIIMQRDITLVAKDGHSLPYAAFLVRHRSTEKHMRTDHAGNARIPRFGVTAVTIKDPRYVEQTWKPDELREELVVERTLLGSGLDKFADKLLQKVDGD